jgi:hypothetical protein
MAYVRVLIGRRKWEEKSLLGMLDSPPKVVCGLEFFYAACGYEGFIWISGRFGKLRGAALGENGWVGTVARRRNGCGTDQGKKAGFGGADTSLCAYGAVWRSGG